MSKSHLTPASERIIEPMIELARCSKLGRIIVAGANSAALMFELHRRGYVRVEARDYSQKAHRANRRSPTAASLSGCRRRCG